MTKNTLSIICQLLFLFPCVAQRFTQVPSDSGVFILHKFQQAIGREVYHTTKANGSTKYDIDFKFVDRGSPVPLTASIRVNAAGEPLSFFMKGKTSRFSQVHDSVSITGQQVFVHTAYTSFTQRLLPNTFTIEGYSPATVQQLLLKYWLLKKQPAHIHTLPAGSLQIRREGIDTVTLNGKRFILNRMGIRGLIWGSEMVWTDQQGNVVCILTIDAEGDKTEMVREAYVSLLPSFIALGAQYGMAAFAASLQGNKHREKMLAIKGGQLIDVEKGIAVPNKMLLIKDGLIAQIGTPETLPANIPVIDATGKSIVPGLWDMHAHFQQTEWGPAYLAAGVTTVRDCGNELDFITATKKAIDSGKGVGPRILMAGIIDGKGPIALGVIQADTPSTAIKAVHHYKSLGFDQIKLYSSVKPAIVRVICDEAHRLGLTVTGHIPRGMNLRAAVDSGMDMVNHLPYLIGLMKADKYRNIDFEDTASQAAIDFVVKHRTVIDPTIGVYALSTRNINEDITKIEPAFYTLPLTLQIQFKSMGVDSATAALYKPALKSMGILVKKLYQAGVPIVAGTDMCFPGYSVARELELYVEGGLTAAEALKTATIIPAQVMGKSAVSGSIAPDKQADLFIVDGNPFTNISDVRNVHIVIKDGQVYDPEKLHRIVEFSSKKGR
ncbi:amidohydrolase family protein [Longitalea luteola]|uniref:amidohydrolase family protein n=1 Tax=Longitalea luteola TaxID=2812563 RepID=UPI001A95E9D5|nr:amidohydrolase family protein [Longitalea luteola]